MAPRLEAHLAQATGVRWGSSVPSLERMSTHPHSSGRGTTSPRVFESRWTLNQRLCFPSGPGRSYCSENLRRMVCDSKSLSYPNYTPILSSRHLRAPLQCKVSPRPLRRNRAPLSTRRDHCSQRPGRSPCFRHTRHHLRAECSRAVRARCTSTRSMWRRLQIHWGRASAYSLGPASVQASVQASEQGSEHSNLCSIP